MTRGRGKRLWLLLGRLVVCVNPTTSGKDSTKELKQGVDTIFVMESRSYLRSA